VPPAPTTAVLSAEAIAGYGYGAGWRGEALAIAVAIALAESSGRPGAVGDINLTVAGEKSVGLWQINYRPARDKLGGPRDPSLNLDPATNARNAYGISGGGTKWSPWSTYGNGAYKTHLTAARAGAKTVEERGGGGSVTAPAGATTGSSSGASSSATGPRSADVNRPLSARRPGRGADAIEVGGRSLVELVGPRLTEATLDLSIDAVPELTFTVHVAGKSEFRFLEHLVMGVEVGLGELRLVTCAIEFGAAAAGNQITVTARSRGLTAMRKDREGTAYSNRSPTQVAESLALANRMGFVGEGSAQRATIARAEKEGGGDKSESAFEMLERLAGELGFVLFDSGNTLHFGRPSWLLDHGTPFEAHYTYRLGHDVIGVPTCRRTVDDEERSTTLDFELGYREGSVIRPGMRCNFEGVHTFAGLYLVTGVSWNPTDPAGLVTVQCSKPVDPTPTGTDTTSTATAAGSTPASSVSAAAQNGKASSLDFVSVALAQVGDTYVYGAETRLDDDDPDTFDCSELVQWACSRVGVTFPDGTGPQQAKVVKISVEQAAKTRGALLFHPGHVAISLGDGVHTVEAMGRKYGVVQGKISGRFTVGGLVPGMNYGTGTTSTSSGGGAIAVVD
jgi:cell wall-associated NlpC family hydrolase